MFIIRFCCLMMIACYYIYTIGATRSKPHTNYVYKRIAVLVCTCMYEAIRRPRVRHALAYTIIMRIRYQVIRQQVAATLSKAHQASKSASDGHARRETTKTGLGYRQRQREAQTAEHMETRRQGVRQQAYTCSLSLLTLCAILFCQAKARPLHVLYPPSIMFL